MSKTKELSQQAITKKVIKDMKATQKKVGTDGLQAFEIIHKLDF